VILGFINTRVSKTNRSGKKIAVLLQSKTTRCNGNL